MMNYKRRAAFFSAFICNCSSLFDLFWKKSMYLHQTKIYSILFYGFSTIQCAIMIPIWFYYAIPVDLLSFTVQDRFICYNDHTSISTQTILSVREQKQEHCKILNRLNDFSFKSPVTSVPVSIHLI